MKNKWALFLLLLTILSCSLEEQNTLVNMKIIPIEAFTVPDTFHLGQESTIIIKYKLPSFCYRFYDLYLEEDNSTRIIAISAIEKESSNCQAVNNQVFEYSFNITATQQNDYILKFWKGKTSNGDDIYEEVIVPVN